MLWPSTLQDVVELAKEALHDKFSDEFGLVDLRSSEAPGSRSRQAETRRFLEALQRISSRKGEVGGTSPALLGPPLIATPFLMTSQPRGTVCPPS